MTIYHKWSFINLKFYVVYCCGKLATVNKEEGNRGKVWGKLAVFACTKKGFVYAAPLASLCPHGFTTKKISILSMIFVCFPQIPTEHSKH